MFGVGVLGYDPPKFHGQAGFIYDAQTGIRMPLGNNYSFTFGAMYSDGRINFPYTPNITHVRRMDVVLGIMKTF
jgi:hypothetical protein